MQPQGTTAAPQPWCIPIDQCCFDYPERLVSPNAWAAHIPFAFWLIQVARPLMLVELGVHTGNSYAAFCQAIQRERLPTQCFGVDSWQGDPQAGFYGDEVYQELAGWHDARYTNFSRLVRASFDEAADHFSAGSIDLLHIDGLHTYDAVRHDFETWRSRLSNQAVVLFHDINVRERDFGVWRFWKEISADYPAFEFAHGHGLGVLGVGASLSPGVGALFEAARNSHRVKQVRDFFARLGMPLMRQVDADFLRQDLARVNELQRATQAELEAVALCLSGARAEFGALRDSLAWRATAPFRIVRRFTRPGPGP